MSNDAIRLRASAQATALQQLALQSPSHADAIARSHLVAGASFLSRTIGRRATWELLMSMADELMEMEARASGSWGEVPNLGRLDESFGRKK